mmetsp:Transcript_51316/g.159054  ORF Transcript_51316/g.159054 Transcript_51316/m.159054 type:complete len:678 (+) Transcript_51316:48-2081(+)
MAMLAYRTDPQDFSAIGAGAGKLKSRTFFECTLKAGDETMNMPVQTCTTIGELKEVLAAQMGYVEVISIDFVVKQGVSYKKLFDTEQVLHKMTVKGLKSFKLPRHKYPHPYGIIGAGYLGLKTAMTLKHLGSENDWVIFDRYDRVGGHTWLEMANKTTKLQTEFPTYHVWYGPEYSMPGMTACGGAPVDWEIWPSRDKVVEHFQIAAEDLGLIPHINFRVNVSNMDIIGKVTDRERYYDLTVDPVIYKRKDKQGGGAMDHQLNGAKSALIDLHEGCTGDKDTTRAQFRSQVSCIAMWPGALVFPRPVTYKGEETFGGQIDYAVEMRFDYSHVPGKVVCIHGHGAFTMENIRTCLEERAKLIHVLCRKINLTCPRPASWFVNQTNPPMSAAQMLDMLQVAYLKYCKVNGEPWDPWTCHSVYANSSRTHATIMQKTRFGIGDVYFLSQAYGLMQLTVDEIKRATFHTLHLEGGGKIECEVVLKCTGCLGDWKVDKLMKIKEMRGLYVNGDFRRACSGEADGINAAQFAATTAGPGYYGMTKSVIHFWDVPNDWHRLLDQGVLDNMPVHKAGEPNEEFPAYFFSAAHSQGAGIALNSMSPLLQQKEANDGEYKKFIQHHCCPPSRIIAEAKADWEQYEEKFRKWGMVPEDAPYVPYLYTEEDLAQQQKMHEEYIVKRFIR